MPYITSLDRVPYNLCLDDLKRQLAGKPLGHLTYVLFTLMVSWAGNQRFDYSTLSSTCAAASDASTEFRRRFVDPYEDNKREINGDVN